MFSDTWWMLNECGRQLLEAGITFVCKRGRHHQGECMLVGPNGERPGATLIEHIRSTYPHISRNEANAIISYVYGEQQNSIATEPVFVRGRGLETPHTVHHSLTLGPGEQSPNAYFGAGGKHWIFDRRDNTLKAYATTGENGEPGECVWDAECHNDAENPGFGFYGQCPPGEYTFGEVTTFDPPQVAYGKHFVAVDDPNSNWAFYGRAGIGVHGGGTGLLDPFAPEQGWQITGGCFRLQNEVLDAFVNAYKVGERFTVT